jgi:hypothetical protein
LDGGQSREMGFHITIPHGRQRSEKATLRATLQESRVSQHSTFASLLSISYLDFYMRNGVIISSLFFHNTHSSLLQPVGIRFFLLKIFLHEEYLPEREKSEQIIQMIFAF